MARAKLSIHIGAKLKNLRKNSGLTQAQLSEILNISPQQIHKIETGKNALSTQQLKILRDKFDICLDEWFSEEENQNPQNYIVVRLALDPIENPELQKKLNFYCAEISKLYGG